LENRGAQPVTSFAQKTLVALVVESFRQLSGTGG
jgi:hypothetical protein